MVWGGIEDDQKFDLKSQFRYMIPGIRVHS